VPRSGGIFSVALSVGSLRPAVSGHRARGLQHARPLSSDFPQSPWRPRPPQRPQTHLIIRSNRLSGSFLLSSILYLLPPMPPAPAQPDTDLLRNIPLFSGLLDANREELAALLQSRQYAPHQPIFWIGEHG